MTHLETWLMAFALAMDCFAVSIASGIILKQIKWRPILLTASLFGFFQAFNPLIGWIGTDYFKELIESIDHWIAFTILFILGVRMIKESFKEEDEKRFNPESLKVIFTMAIATSIDAFAVGISFSCMGISSLSSLLYPLFAIGATAFTMSLVGLLFGIKFGKKYAEKLHAELWGGVILIAIGAKVLIEHTCC
ncbi:MAG: manganese efflux pump [Bacteroidaceae bacterium]|nr:manganese efflux pump [Bacteroidaceae bacterium]